MDNPYSNFATELANYLDKKLICSDPLLNYIYGTDASFYRLIPKIVIKPRNQNEVISILYLVNKYRLSLTFRTAGTSLSGQAVTDSVLVVLREGWDQFSISNDGAKITLSPGLIGYDVNQLLLPYGRKIGPDPASIDSCMIGGIINNNSSGMCCGIAQNSYQTIVGAKLVFVDGTVLDTSSNASRQAFLETKSDLIIGLKQIAAEIKNDPAMVEKIKSKYQIKNTTGYSLNAFVDYQDPFDILLHLIVGSEGTLAFLSEVTLQTVVNYKEKATALIGFSSLEEACRAVEIFRKDSDVVVAELMDYQAIQSVSHLDFPDDIKSLSPKEVCLLVETQSDDYQQLLMQVDRIKRNLESLNLISDCFFVTDQATRDSYWNIRKGILPSVGKLRPKGRVVLTEDIAFPLDKLKEATTALRILLDKYGYVDAGIVGHVLACNLHFIITPDMSDQKALDNYDQFMSALSDMVVSDFGGSLKAEHGTGRNIAPFVEKEWGESAYQIMWRVKQLFDPDYRLNPDVILTRDKALHLKNIKSMPLVDPLIDDCIECGFCESVCPSKNLSFTPRQRIVMMRYIKSLVGQEKAEAIKIFDYYGEKTCAATGLCAITCPIDIDTGVFIRNYRNHKKRSYTQKIANYWAKHYRFVIKIARFFVRMMIFKRRLFGEKLFSKMNLFFAKYIKALPSYKKIYKLKTPHLVTESLSDKVVYFSSCANTVFGDLSEISIQDAFYRVCQRAKYEVIVATDDQLCCGMSFNSKGFFDAAMIKQQELNEKLLALSNNGLYPIVIDASSCMLHAKSKLDKRLKIYDSVSFSHDFLLNRLTLSPKNIKAAFHITCSSQKNRDQEKFINLVKLLVSDPVFPKNVSCCGFAGDKGFYVPELNDSALALVGSEVSGCQSGYSNNKMCEIGLSHHLEINYQSVLFLLEEVSR